MLSARAITHACLAAVLAIDAGRVCNGWAQSTPAEEPILKAAFVYSFAKFTDWPEDLWGKSTKLRVCIAGSYDAFAKAVAALDSKPAVRDRPVEVRSVSRPEEVAACHILVVAGRQKSAELARSVRNAPVLTVGDGDAFAANGGIIGLYVDGEKVRFEVNQDAAQRAGLKLSSQLLRLARLVKDGSAREP